MRHIVTNFFSLATFPEVVVQRIDWNGFVVGLGHDLLSNSRNLPQCENLRFIHVASHRHPWKDGSILFSLLYGGSDRVGFKFLLGYRGWVVRWALSVRPGPWLFLTLHSWFPEVRNDTFLSQIEDFWLIFRIGFSELRNDTQIGTRCLPLSQRFPNRITRLDSWIFLFRSRRRCQRRALLPHQWILTLWSLLINLWPKRRLPFLLLPQLRRLTNLPQFINLLWLLFFIQPELRHDTQIRALSLPQRQRLGNGVLPLWTKIWSSGTNRRPRGRLLLLAHQLVEAGCSLLV